jgi:cullin-associated NEDD8-dissociated protein 1
MTGKDKDYRYMATYDMLNELTKPTFRAVVDLKLKLTNIIIQQLDYVVGDISGLVVKCLAPLVRKMNESRVVEMTSQLCDKILNGKDQHRDTASIALKTVVAEVSTQSLAQSILSILSPQLIKGITAKVTN